MPSFAYVILQYGSFYLTRACIESIERQDPAARIVVVDNCSPDDALEQLNAYASAHQQVHVLPLPENTGFSHGNNVGYEFAVAHYAPDFVVVLNSDVVIEQEDFEVQVSRIFTETGFAVLGPDIYVPTRGAHQNPQHIDGSPFHPVNPTPRVINAAIAVAEEQLLQLDGRPSVARRLRQALLSTPPGKFARTIRQQQRTRRAEALFQDEYSHRLVGVPLQGACFVFSRRFTTAMVRPFWPEVFLYCEETLLQINCQRKGLLMVYDPSARVTHNEGSSTSALFSEDEAAAKQRFKLEHIHKSLLVVQEYLTVEGEMA